MSRVATPEQQLAMRLYANILEEAKFRIGVIESALNGRIPLAGPFLHELCFLQLRFLCELIALGCLVVHGDIKETKSIRKEWSAGKIILRLSEIHPAFYPVPHTKAKTAAGGFHLTLVKEGYLTKDDLVALYAKCGNHLHRGNLKRLLTSPQPTQFRFPDVFDPLNKIGRLLNEHTIPLFEEGTLILALLRNRNDNEKVQVAFAARTETPEPVA